MKEQLKRKSRIKRTEFGLAIFVTLFMTIAGLVCSVQAQETRDFKSEIANVYPGPLQSIAFTSSRDGNNELYLMDPDGSAQTNKSNSLSNDQRPDISPDGSQIVFSSNRDGNFEIFIMDFDGSNIRQLTTTAAPVANSWPRWSPDGEWIAFQSGSGTNFQIYRIRPDGTDLTQVTTYMGLNQFPAWSPDGTRLTIRRDTEIYTINSSDGSDPVRLTFTDSIPGAFNQMASFSPDGTKIAFLSNNRDTPAGPVYLSVYIMDTDGSNQYNFTPKPSDYAGTWRSRAPAWSPNGQYIYFTGVRSLSDTGGNEEIFVKPFAGGDETKLTTVGSNFEASVRTIHAPTINNVSATPNVLWPPKNQMVSVSVNVDVTDNSDPSPVCEITDVTSSETVIDTAWEITGPLSVDLRAQRYGWLTGRIYTISVTCTNSSQLSTTATVTVSVPHDQGRRIFGWRASTFK